MLQPWRVVSNMNFYLAMTHNFGHSHSRCWAGIRCYGLCLWVPNEVRGFSLTPINPGWGISCIPKRDPAAPSWFDGKKLSGHWLTLNRPDFTKAWAKCVTFWCHPVRYLQGVCTWWWHIFRVGKAIFWYDLQIKVVFSSGAASKWPVLVIWHKFHKPELFREEQWEDQGEGV